MNEHHELCPVNTEHGRYSPYACMCVFIENLEIRARAEAEEFYSALNGKYRMFIDTISIVEGDEVEVTVADGVIRGKARRNTSNRGLTVCGVTVVDPYSKRVSDNIVSVRKVGVL